MQSKSHYYNAYVAQYKNARVLKARNKQYHFVAKPIMPLRFGGSINGVAVNFGEAAQ